jgi:DNA-binding IscR family transcriptional regulator
MAADRGHLLTSEALARSAGTNPAVARRLLAALGRAGLTAAQLGKGGGTELARGPKKITLADIYLAVEEPGLVPLHRSPPDQACPVGRAIGPVLAPVIADAEDAFLRSLETVTLKQIVRGIAAANAAAKSAA